MMLHDLHARMEGTEGSGKQRPATAWLAQAAAANHLSLGNKLHLQLGFNTDALGHP